MQTQPRILAKVVAAILVMGATHSTSGDDPLLEIEGDCPGVVTVRVSNNRPGSFCLLVFGWRLGPQNFPLSHPCYGQVLGIRWPLLVLDEVIDLDENGDGSITGHAGPRACGNYLQGVPFGCLLTNVAQMPE